MGAPGVGTEKGAKARIRARAVPLIVATALLMENIDASVLSTSLPAIAADLDTNPIHLKLALTSYLLALAIFIPASGWAADRFGARKVFRWAIGIFALGSIACGLSDGLLSLILSRVLQGLGGSMMVPVGRLIVLRASPKAGLVAALAWLTVPALLGPVIGPPLGGFITTFFHWRWIFWVNIPIAILGVFLVSRYIPRVPGDAVRRLDSCGFLLVGPGLAGFLTGVTLAGLDLAPRGLVWAMILGGLILILAYIRHALRVTDPLVDLRLMRLATFRISALAGTLFRIGSGALPFLLPLLFQVGFGLTAFQSGMMTFASGGGALLMKFLAPPLLSRFGFRRVLAVNAVISAVFILAPAGFGPETPYLAMVGVLFLGGVSRSLQFTSINAVAYAEVSPEEMSSATSFNAVLQQLSGSVGITLAAFGIEAVQGIYGLHEITAGLFAPVFVMIATLAFVSSFGFLRLEKSAGSSLL
jgi:EmrB/QacA subfamily drug resistance transporter